MPCVSRFVFLLSSSVATSKRIGDGFLLAGIAPSEVDLLRSTDTVSGFWKEERAVNQIDYGFTRATFGHKVKTSMLDVGAMS